MNALWRFCRIGDKGQIIIPHFEGRFILVQTDRCENVFNRRGINVRHAPIMCVENVRLVAGVDYIHRSGLLGDENKTPLKVYQIKLRTLWDSLV